MTNLTLKQKIIGLIVAVGIALIAIFQQGLGGKSPAITPKLLDDSQTQEIKIISTNPSPLEETTILPTQTIEITFNQPLENAPEFRTIMDPKADYKIELSDDRKTAKIIPNKPYVLGGGYTLHILGNTKFEGKRELNREEIFHFKTISYSGV